MQCTGNSSCFPRGKRTAIVRRYPAFSFFIFFFSFFIIMCNVSCFHTTRCEAYSFTADGYWIFNVRTNLGPCSTHEEAGSCRHKQVCTGSVDSERQKNWILPRPARGSNPGSSDLNSDAVTTERRTSPVYYVTTSVEGNLCGLHVAGTWSRIE